MKRRERKENIATMWEMEREIGMEEARRPCV